MRRIGLILLFLALLLTIPVSAQETDNEPIPIQITDVLTYEDVNGNGIREVLVGGVVILPPPGFSSGLFTPGQMITVIGVLRDDDVIEASSFFVANPQAEITPETTEAVAESNEQSEDEREREEEQHEEELEREEEQREREEEQREEELEREEEQREDREIVEIAGEVTEVTQNTIMVDGTEIEGGGIFQPSLVEVGQIVRVTGIFENNGRLRAITIEAIDAETLDAEVTPEAGGATCVPETHPVVEILTDEFALEASAIIDMYCSDSGFGDITRALLLSAETGEAPQSYLERLNNGGDWGDITRDAGFEPGVITPDSVLGGR